MEPHLHLIIHLRPETLARTSARYVALDAATRHTASERRAELHQRC